MPEFDKSFFDKDSEKNPSVTLDNLVSLKECIVDITVHAISEFASRKISEEELNARLDDFVGIEESFVDDCDCCDSDSCDTDAESDSCDAKTCTSEAGSCASAEGCAKGSECKKGDKESCDCEGECQYISIADRANAIRAARNQNILIAHQILQDWILVDGSDADMPVFAKKELVEGFCNNLFNELFVLPEAFVNLLTKNLYSIVNGLNYLAHELIYLCELKYGSDDAIEEAGIDLKALKDCAEQLNNFDESSTTDVQSLDISALCFDAAEYLDLAASSLRVLGHTALALKAAA